MEHAPPSSPAVDAEVLASAIADGGPFGDLTFHVGDDVLTYSVAGTSVRCDLEHGGGSICVRLSPTAFEDLVGQVRTIVGLFLGNELEFERGTFGGLVAWEPILRYLHAGIPPFDPLRVDLNGRDPQASFSMDADDAELAEQLRTLGYLHIKGVFDAEEMEAANREVDRLSALASPEDDQSWWVTGDDGTSSLCRLIYATLRSPLLAALESDPRVERLGTLLDPALRVAPDRMEGSPVLIKVPGRTSGLSNIPWHQDCGTGGHAFICPAVSVGIQFTGSTAETGNLQVIAGSHGQTLRYGWLEQMANVEIVTIDTQPGDVTVHVQDLMHASPAPLGEGNRRTMYVTHYPPTLFEHIGPGEALNDLVRNRTDQVAQLQHR